MVRGNTVNELVDALSVPQQTSSNVYSAVVANVDNEGVVWVHVEGSSKVTPTASRVAEVKQGDHVSVEWRNNKLYISGNYTTPATDDTAANIADAKATNAQEAVTVLNTLVANTIVADNARFNNLEADTAKIHNLTAQEIQATVGYIDDLTTGNVTASDIVADHATIEDLDVQSMSAATAYIGALTAGNVTAQNIISDHGTIGSLDSNYAEIDLANVNNAWIQNGVVKDAAISDAQIIGVSANKLTAGTIDASNITVTNLNASNITTGSITVDGITIDVTNNEASIDGSYIDEGTITLSGLAQEVTDKIDGAIETFTGNVVPTLNNYPASGWTTSTIRDTHIGDVYYVINAGNQADGYCYRFAKSGNTYQWVLIKDSDVTAALQRLTEAEGDIAGLESFESTTSSWITETDAELSSLKTNVTSLTTRVGDAEDEIETKVNTSTFNTLSQTVGENSANITSLTTITTNNGLTSSTNISNAVNNVSQKATSNESKISNLTTVLGTNADGTTKSTDIVHQVSDISQDLSGITTRVGKTEVQIKGSYATSSTAKGTTAKTATIVPAVTGWELYTGATITVKFTNENTTTSPTLNVNSTGAKGIRNYSGGTLSEAERQWPAGATMSFVYDGTYWRIQDSTELTRLKTAESSITQTADSIVSLVANNDTYTKPDGTTATNTIKSAIKQNADNIELRVEKSGVIASINASTETSGGSAVRISADKVNIEGAAIFTGSGRLSSDSLNAAYDANGAATGAVSALTTDLASSSGTTVINGGHIATGSISIGQVNNLQSTLSDAGTKATNYITNITSDGAFVHAAGDSSISTGSGVHIGASAINIIKSGVSYIKAWISNNVPYIRIGREDKGNVLIDNDSVDIRDGTTVSASFGANLISLGNPSNSPHVEVTPNTMTFYDSNGGDSAAIEFYDDDNWEKRFVIRSEQTSDDYAGVAVVASDYIGSDIESEVQIYSSKAVSNPEVQSFSAMRVSGAGVRVDFHGNYTGSKPFTLRDIYDDNSPSDIFKIDALGFCTAATDGLLFSDSDALALFDVTTGTITSLAMYRYGKVIQLNVAFKNTSSVASNSNVLEATWAPGWADDIKPINSVNGSSFYGKTPLPGSFTASNGRLIVHNASTAAVTVSSNTLITFTYIAKNAL